MPDTQITPSPLSRETIQAQLYALLRAQLKRADEVLSDDFHFTDAGIASIEVMMLIFDIEEKFDIALVDSGLDDFDTLGELVTLVHGLVDRKARQA